VAQKFGRQSASSSLVTKHDGHSQSAKAKEDTRMKNFAPAASRGQPKVTIASAPSTTNNMFAFEGTIVG